jgi:hypothetical protein
MEMRNAIAWEGSLVKFIQAVKAERWLQTLGLAWPQCFDSLPYTLATDLKKADAQSEQVI